MSTGERIRRFRLARGLTQAQVAAAIGATEGAVRHYEKGVRTPGPEQLAGIAKALGVNVAALTDYGVEDTRDALEVLFRLEEMTGLRPVQTEDGLVLVMDGQADGAEKINYALVSWKAMRDDLQSGAISQDEYDEWKASFNG